MSCHSLICRRVGTALIFQTKGEKLVLCETTSDLITTQCLLTGSQYSIPSD